MAWRGSATTTATIMSPRAPELRRRWIRWLVPGALVVLAPKCVLCVAGWLGLGATLGWTGVEICGVPDNTATHGVAWLAVATVALGGGGLAVRRWAAKR